MNTKELIESIGLNAEEVKLYLLSEINEFLEAEDIDSQNKEFHDIIFALKNLVYAHTGKHFEISPEVYENKIKERLKKYAAISRKEPIFYHKAMRDIPIGVVHISFGNFKQPWSNFDPFKNGTEAEIAMLTDNEFKKHNNFTNHIILTFDNVDELEYTFLTSSLNMYENNTILCRIPDFIFKNAKNKFNFKEVEELLSLQLFSALNKMNLLDDCIFHFHSWESALGIKSEEFNNMIKNRKKYFSPYLTVSRLRQFLLDNNKYETTLNQKELDLSSEYEEFLVKFCDKTIVESENDRLYYDNFNPNKVNKYSYSNSENTIFPANKIENNDFTFITGGRPVYEKGFLELLKEVPSLIEYSKDNNLNFKLKIFCKEYDRATNKLKKQDYLKELDKLILELNLSNYVEVLDKVSITKLKEEIKNSCGLIVPSLYDPYCLMPHYSISEKKVSFVSKYTGISDNIESKNYIFDPLLKGSLLESIKKWIETPEDFILNNKNKTYKSIYID